MNSVDPAPQTKVDRSIMRLALARALLSALALSGCGGGESAKIEFPSVPQAPTGTSLSMTIAIRASGGAPSEVSLALDGTTVARVIPLCTEISGGIGGEYVCPPIRASVSNLEPGSTHSMTFRVHEQFRAAVFYRLDPTVIFSAPASSLWQQVFASSRQIWLSSAPEENSVAWDLELAR
jgi:hypothetical protein